MPSSHKVGMKRVLLAANESGCAITQFAVTELKAGEVADAHVHEDMMEGFCVMSGELDMVLDGEVEHCKEGDFENQGGTGTFIHKIFPHISSNKSHKCAA